jgi:hypothetical protein
MHTLSLVINLVVISIFLLPAYAAEFPQKLQNTEPVELKKPDRIMFGMTVEEVTAISGNACHPTVDNDYKPKGVANYIKCKNLKL